MRAWIGVLAAVVTSLALVAVGALLGGHAGLGSGGDLRQGAPPVSVRDVLAGEAEGFARADRPRVFRFPEDHGPHPEYRSEWWYFTGNLDAGPDRRFGFQLTLFRFGLDASPPPRRSAWAASQAFMGHLALTDVAAGRFHAFERVARGALGLAGARGGPALVWVEDWRVDALEGGEGFRLRGADGGVALDLEVRPVKPVVLQGEAGLSQKSPEPGNASYYYSWTRMAARGEVTVEGRAWPVEGLAWMDREWSTSALGPDQVGWDWLALQLDDGRDLMFYQLRRGDGTRDPLSKGTVVDPDGRSRPLDAGALALEVLGEWESPRDGARYPGRWRLTVPSEALALEVRPLLADQELMLSVRYWEGAVAVQGTSDGRPVAGRGYVELTGYAR